MSDEAISLAVLGIASSQRTLLAMTGYLMYAVITRMSAPMTATNPIALNIFCQSTHLSLFFIRLRKKSLNG